jgi:thiosulfate reductase cytochrome b subunit
MRCAARQRRPATAAAHARPSARHAVGGYEVVRRIHFVAMSGIVGFTLIHLTLVCIVPRTLPSMITGRTRLHDQDATP